MTANSPSVATIPPIRSARFQGGPSPPRAGARVFILGFDVARLPPGRRGSRSSSVGPAAIRVSLSPGTRGSSKPEVQEDPGSNRGGPRQNGVGATDRRGIETRPQRQDGLLREIGGRAERLAPQRRRPLHDQRRGDG